MKLDYQKLADYIEYKPNQWQREVQKSDARFKVICAGRRSGKSLYVTNDPKDGIVSDLLIPNQYVWVVAPNYDLTQRVWVPIVQLARFKFPDVIKRIWDTKGAFRLETHLGTTIEAKSAEDPEKLVGAGLTKIIIDEAALIKKKAWYESLRPTLIGTKTTKVGKAIFIGTPKGKNHFYDLWLNGKDPNKPEWESWRYSSYDNEYLDKKELDKLTKDMPEYEYRQEILAEFEETAEQVFRNIKKNIKYTVQIDEPHVMGIDLGRKGAYSVVYAVGKKTQHVNYSDRFRKVSWDLQVKRIKEAINKYNPYPIVVDATGIGDPVVEELERAIGRKVESFIFTEVSKRQLIDKLALWVEKGLITYPDIPQLLLEMERYNRETGETGKVKFKSTITTDCIMALALAVWPLREYTAQKTEPIILTHPKY